MRKIFKDSVIISSFLFLIASILAAYLVVLLPEKTFINLEKQTWTRKEREIRSELKRVPVLLYHNIDGKGPFSVSSDTLRSHFDFLKQNDIRVVSLQDLVNRLEDPKPYSGRVVVITFDDGYKSMYTKLLPLVKEYKYPVTLFVYADFISDKGRSPLTWKELKIMDASGIDIQSHTISHPDLTVFERYSDEEKSKIFHEMYMCKRIIEKKLAKEVNMIAVPYGRFNQDVLMFAKLAGYKKVLSTEFGANIITRNNYTLHRHHIKSSYSIETIRRIVYQY